MKKQIKEDLLYLINSSIVWFKFKNATFLITGANGMIATYIIYLLMELNKVFSQYNIKVIAQVRNRKRAEEKFKQYLDLPNFAICSRDLSENLYFHVDYIIHAASPATSSLFNIEPLNVINANVIATKYLLDLAVEEKIKGFLFLSTGGVSGKVDKEIITEDDYGVLNLLDVNNVYIESKRMGEMLCRCYTHQFNLDTYIARIDHTYGPSLDLSNDNRVFADFINCILHHRDIKIKSDGQGIRTFTYITDCIEGLFRILSLGKAGEAYNVSNNDCKTIIKDLAIKLIKMYPERNLAVKCGEGNFTNIYSDDLRPSLSTKKIEELGYKAKIGIEEGFKRTIDSFMEENE
jgi:nucleoside-diphosphate-sugar epimerase